MRLCLRCEAQEVEFLARNYSLHYEPQSTEDTQTHRDNLYSLFFPPSVRLSELCDSVVNNPRAAR